MEEGEEKGDKGEVELAETALIRKDAWKGSEIVRLEDKTTNKAEESWLRWKMQSER